MPPTKQEPPPWTCPICGRSFQHTGQSHVCSTATVDDHLRDKPPEVIALFQAFVQAIQAVGSADYAPVRGQVGFRGQKRIFAGIKLTMRGLEGYLDLPRRVESPRFRRIAPYTKRLFVHYFTLTASDQLDPEFCGWIEEAYQVGEGRVLSSGESAL